MRIPKFWTSVQRTATGQDGIERYLMILGWSFDGLEEARQLATERLERAIERLRHGEALGQYEYLDVPLREEVVETFHDSEEEIAIITRNRYGATILNTADVLFADIDLPPIEAVGFFDAIALIFSRRRRQERWAEAEQRILRGIGEWTARNPDRTFRLYRTHSGFRLLFTDRRYDPTSEETADLLRDLGSDPLYLRLTQKQECFRARLSPKPWRCGCDKPPCRFPYEDGSAEQAYARWLEEYSACAPGYSVCTLLDAPQTSSADERIEQVIALHDAETGVGTDKPLA